MMVQTCLVAIEIILKIFPRDRGIGTVAKIVDIIILKNLGSLLKNTQEVL